MARILMVGGGCRGRTLARDLVASGHAVRITTRDPRTTSSIEHAGAEAWIGTPAVIGSLRYALENVTVLCWLLGTARGDPGEVAVLHGSRLEMMLSQTIDTTVRGVVYEAAGTVDEGLFQQGTALALRACRRSGIPFAALEADPGEPARWGIAARRAIDGLLAGGGSPLPHPLRAQPAGPGFD